MKWFKRVAGLNLALIGVSHLSAYNAVIYAQENQTTNWAMSTSLILAVSIGVALFVKDD